MIALSRPRDGLAFLSDEAILIAAGMLFAGYGGVVGTMWSINDKLVPRVARDVYGQLFRNGRLHERCTKLLGTFERATHPSWNGFRSSM